MGNLEGYAFRPERFCFLCGLAECLADENSQSHFSARIGLVKFFTNPT